MYKSIHSKNYRWCISCGTFPLSAKGSKPYKKHNYVYHNGIRFWKDTSMNCLNIAFVIHLFRIIFSIPIGREISECC